MDETFIVEKEYLIQQLKAVTPRNNKDIIEIFNAYSVLFDEVIQRLPASASLLARIKQEYEGAIVAILSRQHMMAANKQRTLVKCCEVATFHNYHKRIKELKFKATKLRLDNERVNKEMSKMNAEIEPLVNEKEQRYRLSKSTPHITSGQRRSLGLSLKEAISLSHLQSELERVGGELEEVKIITEKKYIPADRKAQLRKQLNEKEQVKLQVDQTNNTLSQQLKRLKLATRAVATYHSYLKQHMLDSSALPLEHYITAVIESNYDQIDDEELDQDPAKEMEVEMVLDCFEKFNELFESECYEEAALHAASSPKGVLRTMETLNKFKHSARTVPGCKPPLLCYCEHLMRCAPAYRALSKEEELECAQCALDNDGVPLVAHWIAQEVLYPSKEVGKLLMDFCKCDTRCMCGCLRIAYSVLDKSGEHKLAALCLVHQENLMMFLSYAKKAGFTKEDYAKVLCEHPSTELVEALTHPHNTEPLLTRIEAAHMLLQSKRNEYATELISKEVAKLTSGHLQSPHNDMSDQDVVWDTLINCLHTARLDGLAMECLSALTVRRALLCAITALTQEPPADNLHSVESTQHSQPRTPYDDESSVTNSPDSVTDSEYESSGGYSSELESESLSDHNSSR